MVHVISMVFERCRCSTIIPTQTATQGEKPQKTAKNWQGQREKADQEAICLLVKKWKLTKSELDLLEVKLYTQDTCQTAPPPTSCSWFRDLTEEGVEPHPGPSNSLQLCAVNVAGRENAWALARTVVDERPAVVILQEHCMLPDKQADLARFLDKRGYRSWWVVQPAARNANGQSYTSGGGLVRSIWTQLSHEKKPWLVGLYIGDYSTLQLYGDYKKPL